ncbi:MAG: ABC transporter ATP-binding protein [Actinomycetota bacterium]|nr:ABC transporter ATP-binding protein [Actinomycetota bacterium]
MLTIENLVKTFPAGRKEGSSGVRAVNDLSLSVQDGKLFTLLGPSGCGKTTTLRCVSGLEQPDSGEIAVGDRILFSSKKGIRLRANERGLGMVFQSYAIWPHMNVFKNVAFPLTVLPRKKRLAKAQIKERVDRVLSVVRLDQLAGRQATDLSGGQQQRLALARALVMEPPLLLLDEPLSNLDAKLREDMRFELKRLQRELGITAIYVTHDQVEALAMSNRIAVIKDGKIEQIGKPREIYENPQSRFVADFIGTSNFIPGVIESKESSDRFMVKTTEGAVRVTSELDLTEGTEVTVAIRPEHVGIEPGQANDHSPNRWGGSVNARAFLGESIDHVVSVGSLQIRARCNPSLSIRPGTEVILSFPEGLCSLIPGGE